VQYSKLDLGRHDNNQLVVDTTIGLWLSNDPNMVVSLSLGSVSLFEAKSAPAQIRLTAQQNLANAQKWSLIRAELRARTPLCIYAHYMPHDPSHVCLNMLIFRPLSLLYRSQVVTLKTGYLLVGVFDGMKLDN